MVRAHGIRSRLHPSELRLDSRLGRTREHARMGAHTGTNTRTHARARTHTYLSNAYKYACGRKDEATLKDAFPVLFEVSTLQKGAVQEMLSPLAHAPPQAAFAAPVKRVETTLCTCLTNAATHALARTC